MRSDSKCCQLCTGPSRLLHADPRTGQHYYQCERCELVWLDPAHYLSRDAERAHYGLHENNPDDPNYRAFLNHLWQPLRAKLQPGASGLDYGSGPGPTRHRMAQEDGYACTHYDPFFHPDKSVFGTEYDFISCSETAEHFHYPADEFRQLKSLLKPGGWLGVMTSRLVPETEFANWHYRRDPSHVSFYTEATFRFIACHYGFKLPVFVSNSVVLLQIQ